MMGSADRLLGRRAQVSLEFLVLLAAFLAFIGVWLSLIFSVESGVSNSLEYSRLESLASDIQEGADGVCLMGPGSSKVVKVGWEVKLVLSGKELTAEANGKKITALLRCESWGGSVEVSEGDELIVKNVRGKIEIKEG